MLDSSVTVTNRTVAFWMIALIRRSNHFDGLKCTKWAVWRWCKSVKESGSSNIYQNIAMNFFVAVPCCTYFRRSKFMMFMFNLPSDELTLELASLQVKDVKHCFAFWVCDKLVISIWGNTSTHKHTTTQTATNRQFHFIRALWTAKALIISQKKWASL